MLASVARARARGVAAAAAARRAAVDVAAAAEGAKAARRAAEEAENAAPFASSARTDERPLDASETPPATTTQRRIDFTAEASVEDRDGGDARRGAVSRRPSRASVASDPSEPFRAFDAAATREAPATAPLRAALRAFAAVGLGARFAARVREQRALQLRAEMRYDARALTGGGADDALRRLINETLAKFVGHFVVERDVARDLAADACTVSSLRSSNDALEPVPLDDVQSSLERTFGAAARDLESFVVAAVADAEQAAVARAAAAAVERACFALTRLGPGFEAAPRLRDAAVRAARARVVEILTEDTVDACARGDDARAALARDATPPTPPTPGGAPLSAFAADLASSAEAFASETGAFLGGLARGDARGSAADLRDASATARRATRACVARLAETCALPLFAAEAAPNGANVGAEPERGGGEASAARLIADAAWLDARVDEWDALAAEAATRAFRAADADVGAREARETETDATRRSTSRASSQENTDGSSPFAATALASERALLRAARARVASATAATAVPGEWAPSSPPMGASERASTLVAYFYGPLRRALAISTRASAAAAKKAFSRVAAASLSLCADETLRAMEAESTKTINAHGLLGLSRDLEAFEHVAATLAETALGSESERARSAEADVSRDDLGDAREKTENVLLASLGSLRVLLRLCAARADGADSNDGHGDGRDAPRSLEAFVADAFADAANASAARVDDAACGSGDAETFGGEPLTRARAARILEKYRDAPSNGGTGTVVDGRSISFASKKRIDAVVEALKAR